MQLVISLLVSFVLLFSLVIPSSGEEFAGGYGTNWVQSGMTIPAGSMMVTSHGRVWTKNFSNVKTRNMSGVVGVHFGFMRNIELGLSQILYQDPLWADPYGKLGISDLIPFNLEMRLKFGNIYTTWGQLLLVHSFTGGMSYPASKVNNLPYHTYYSAAMEPSMTFSTSWYSRPLTPEESQFFGVSITYKNHNDVVSSITKSAQSITYSMAYTYPVRNTISLGGQVAGLFFARMPKPNVFSREPYAYLSVLGEFRIMEGLSFLVSPEFLITNAKNSTKHKYDTKKEKNYEPWRLNGMFKFIPPTPFYKIDPFAKTGEGRRSTAGAAIRERLSRQTKLSLFDWTVDSEVDLLFLNSDLMRAQQERERAEAELKRLENELRSNK
ncbi:MAG: hypothetical protein N2450_02970 [bacterium]|nr:hypothetical protein [bacterium]